MPIVEELEKKIKDLEARLADLMLFVQIIEDQSLVGIVIAQANPLRLSYANSHLAELFGYTHEEFISLGPEGLEDLIHVEDREMFFGRFMTRLQGKDAPKQYSFRGIKKDGSEIKLLLNSSFIDYKGEPATLTLFTDITQLKFAEEALHKSQENLQLVMNNTREAILIAQDGIVKFPNPQAEKMSGYSKEELSRIPFADLIHPKDRGLVVDRYVRRLKGDQPPEIYSFRIINKNGEEIWVQATVSHVMWEERPATLAFLTDITEQKRLENQLRQSQKMEAIGTLAGGIAHEFNNILGIIMGNAELAIDDVPEWNPAKECIDEILSASIRGKDVVKQILAFTHNSPIEKKQIEISPIIEETLKLLRASIPSTIRIKKEIACGYDMVLADPTQISQLIINLCTNAKDAIESEDGIVELKLENVRLDKKSVIKYEGLNPGNYMKLTVRDNGLGIDPKIMDRIFDPFFTTKGITQGTGMGLSVIDSIVKSHDGAVLVKSVLGKGTDFEVLLPCVENRDDSRKEIDELMLHMGNERILLVDDEEGLVRSYSFMLKNLGYDVINCTDPISALKIFKQRTKEIDLVITDMSMPVMTGEKLVRELIKICPDIPIILCTGYSENMEEDRAEKIGVRAFLMKPISKETFAITVRQVLDGNSPI